MKIYEITYKVNPSDILFTVEATNTADAIELAMQYKQLDFQAFRKLFDVTEKVLLDERVQRSNVNLLKG